jgi:putative surface-exposed virulence protein
MFSRKITTILAATALVAAFAVLAGPSEGSSSLPITTCGQTVTTNAVLTQDLTCAGQIGIYVGASGITIDLQGHTLSGDQINDGIRVNGWDRVTIKNGVVRNFAPGVSAFNSADNLTISNLVLSGNTSHGASIEGDSASIKSTTASGNGQSGIYVNGDNSASITSVNAVGNGAYGVRVHADEDTIVKSSSAAGNALNGFYLEGDSTSVSSSTASGNAGHGLVVVGISASVKSTKASGNGGHGIYVSGDAATLTRNRAEGNGFQGGGSDGIGQGILVQGFATAPAGTNLARGNDDPANCQPSSLCPAPASKSVKAGVTPITTCGQVVTTNALLTQDLTCAGTGVIVGASGITIDLNGHVLKGDGTAGHYGIDNKSGYEDLVVKNGVVRNFDTGVYAIGYASRQTVSSVVVVGNVKQGIYVSGPSATIASSTAAGNGQTGIHVLVGPGSVTSSTASGNGLHGIWMEGTNQSVKSSTAVGNAGYGVVVSGDAASVTSASANGNKATGVRVVGNLASIKSSTTSGNGDYGIAVSGDATVLQGNRAEANGFPGGNSDGAGLGILASNYTVAPTGTNVARGNDDPAQCMPATL